ncbi:MAG: ABC transporter permease [Polyangia bacterium]|jgi:lipoprotein-releasing system permease protein|nr:ABC transporter permease [Polyangia bacterium]
MFEIVTAWRYLFKPEIRGEKLLLALWGLLTTAFGALGQQASPTRPIAIVVAALVTASWIAAGLVFGLRGGKGRVGRVILLVITAGFWAAQLLLVSLSAVPVTYLGAFGLGAGLLALSVALLWTVFTMFTTVSILAVFFAVGTMVMGRAVTSGFSQEFKDKVLGFNAHVLVMKWGYGLTEYKQVIREVKGMENVTGAAPFTISDMLIAKDREHTHVLMKGVPPKTVGEVLDLRKYILADGPADLETKIQRMSLHLDKGGVGPGQPGGCEPKFDPDGDPIPGSRGKCLLPGVVIGKRLAERLAAKEGDIVRLISPTAEIQKMRGASSGQGAPPQARDFRVAGIFYCGFEEYDQKLVFVHLEAAQQFLYARGSPDEDAVLGVEIKLSDIYEAPEVAARIEQKLGGQPYRVITWMQLNRPLFSALRMQRLIFVVIGIVVLGVAAFCILAALAMMVIDKTREVAILRSMGASSGGIARAFLMVSLLIGFFGSVLGAGFGLIMSHSLGRLDFPLDPKVYLISRLPVMVDHLEVAAMVLGTLLLCFVAALYPAFKAAAMRPVEGLRYE